MNKKEYVDKNNNSKFSNPCFLTRQIEYRCGIEKEYARLQQEFFEFKSVVFFYTSHSDLPGLMEYLKKNGIY